MPTFQNTLFHGVTPFDHIYYCHRLSLYITHTEHTSSLNVLNISTNKHELVYNYLSSSDDDSCCSSTCFRKCPSKVCWWCVNFCVNCTAAEFKTATTPAWVVWRSGILLYLSSSFTLINLSSMIRRWNRQSVPKHQHIKFRRRGITQKKAYNIQNMAKVWNQEYLGCYHRF